MVLEAEKRRDWKKRAAEMISQMLWYDERMKCQYQIIAQRETEQNKGKVWFSF